MAASSASVSKRAAAAVAAALLLAACDAVPPELEKNWVRLRKEWDALLTVMTGGRSPLAKKPARPSPTAEPELASPNARNAKANGELLHEVFLTVLMHEPADRAQFGSLVDSLNQGASIEGMYNGVVHSSEYRSLELARAAASVEALRVFGEEMALLELEPSAPKAAASSTPAPSAAPSATPDPVVLKARAEQIAKQNVGASIFVLKRMLGGEALRVVDGKRDYRENLAFWYSRWVARMAGRGVDFGLPQRNKADEPFHYKWAMDSSEDRVKWEVLNRLHRVLNDANQRK